MKKFLIVFLCIAIIFLIWPYLFKIYYSIKEPKFLFPVLYSIDNLQNQTPIRHDGFGNGEFGAKRKGNRTHSGIDILAKVGTPVIASKSGRVSVGQTPGIGKYVYILHPDGSATLYGHLSKVQVKQNQWVHQANIIGNVGKTGNAARWGIKPHLHFEIRIKNKPVNPLDMDMDVDKGV